MMKTKKMMIKIGMFFIPFLFSIPSTILLSQTIQFGAISTSFHMVYFLGACVIAIFLSVFFHEIGHAFAFLIQGIRIRAIFIFFLGIIFHKRWRLVVDKTMLILFGGIVIPNMMRIDDDAMFLEVSKKFRISLLAAPIVSYVWLIIIIIVTVLVSHLFLLYLMFWVLTITLMFTRSFFIHKGMVLGDFVAFKYLKTHPEYVIILLLQLGKQQQYDLSTAKYLYHKAEVYLNTVTSITSRSNYLLLQYVCDGYRLGYLKKQDMVPKWVLKASMKRHIPKAFLMMMPTLIYTLIYYGKIHAAYKLYLYFIKYEKDSLPLNMLKKYVFDIELPLEDVKHYIALHAMYKHTLHIPFVKYELTKKANDITFACEI